MEKGSDEIPLSGDPRVDAALMRIKGKFKDLEDNMIVQVHLERKMGERIKERAELIADHETAIADHRSSLRASDERLTRMEVLMEEMNGKVEFLLNREMRREGGPEAR